MVRLGCLAYYLKPSNAEANEDETSNRNKGPWELVKWGRKGAAL